MWRRGVLHWIYHAGDESPRVNFRSLRQRTHPWNGALKHTRPIGDLPAMMREVGDSYAALLLTLQTRSLPVCMVRSRPWYPRNLA